MSNTEVETIGVRLTLDAAGYIGKAEAVTAANNAMSTSAQKAASGASQMRAAGGAQVAGGGRAVTGTGPSTSQMAAVNVPLTVNAESLATLRAAIIKGIGSIPINISPTVSKTIATEAKNVVAAVSTPAIGTRSGAVRAVETAVRNNMPTRAFGGAVQQGRATLVGEKGPEVYTPRAHGTIHANAEQYYREQGRLRKREAELAALEYQQQQQHERSLRNLSPRRAIRRVRDEALLRLDMAIDRYDNQAPQRLPHRARGGAVQISRLPGGGGHYAPRPEGLYHAIQDTINHYQDHSAPGGYVGVAPVGRGYAVQLHNPAGEIESWRILRNIKKAGFGALAYRATMENEGGTFPLSGGPQPPKGYAVGIATGTSHLVEDPSNFRDFLKQFNAQKKSQLAAGSFPPYVGTWLHEGQIHIDPAAVLGRKREADMVARAKEQLAFFDLKRFDEIPTSSHRLRANAERIQQLIMAGRKRESGGPISRSFTVADPMGLHIRPSALLAKVAARFPDTDIRTRNLTSGFAPHEKHGFEHLNARQMWDWGLLGAKTGDQVEITGEGGQASLALHQLARLGGSDKITGLAKRRLVRNWRSGRAGGGRVNAFERSGKEAELLHRYNPNLVLPHTEITPEISERIDRIRAAAREHWMGIDELRTGNPIYIGQAIGSAGSVAPSNAKPVAGLPYEIMRRWRTGGDYHSHLTEMSGLTGIHNHPPGYKGVSDVWRASIPDIRTMFSAREKESWVVTPSYTQIMRNTPSYSRRFPDQRSLGRVMAQGLAEELGEDPGKFVNPGMQGFTPRFIRDFSSPEVLGSFSLQRAMFDRAAEEYGFNWELYKHPTVGRWQRPTRAAPPVSGQMGFGMAAGGWVVPSSTPKNPLRGLLRLPENARDLHANIRAHAETVKPGVIEEARDWWTIAHAQAVGDLMDPIIGGKTSWSSLGMDALSGLGAFAAASSGQEWRSNRAIVRHLLETGVPQTSGSSNVPGFGETSFSAGRGLGPIEDAWAFLMGREGSPTGPKRGAMLQNITGLDPNAITYDSRMSQIITAARRHTGPNSKTFWKAPAGSDMIRKLGIGAMEDLYPEYAKRWDLHNLSEFQAILWSGLDTNVNAAHKGAGLGTDWLRTQRGISIPRHPGLEIPFHRAAGGPALGGMTPPLNQIAKPGFVSSMFQTAADWANDPFMAIMAWQQQAAQHKARGGYVPNRDWERRRERLRQYRAGVFNPKRIERVGPPRLNEDFVGAPLPFTGGTLVGDRRWNETMGSLNDPRRWTRALAGNYMRGVYGTNWTKGGHAEGGPVLGPLQRRILGLPEPPKVEMPKPVEPFEPEWLKRARTSKLPPKIYRAEGGDVRHLYTVADQLGLHMRPSAHLARMASDFDAMVTVENLTRGLPREAPANAKYVHHLLMLAARQGDQLRLRATGTDAEAAIRALGGMIESPGLTRIASSNRSLEKMDPAQIRAAQIFSKFTGRAGGGDSPKGLYIVGEIGRELFVPSRLTHMIPKRVMDQIPKAQGGMQVIGQKPNSLFAPPEDGIIVPNRLMDQVPHAARGTRTERMRAAAQEAMARADVWGEPGPIPFLEATPPPTRRRAAPSSALLEIEAIERADREKVVAATIKKARSGRAQYMPSRENMGEELAVMRAGAGKVMPSRTPAGAVAAIGSFLFGGVQQMTKAERERVEAANAYTSAFNRTNRTVGEGRAAQVGLRADLDANRIHHADYTKALRGIVEPIREAKRVEAQRLDVLKEATTKAMPTTGGVLKNLGVIIGATTAYGMAMQLASTVITDAAIPALGKVVDQLTGFKSTATATSTALGQATYEAHGNIQATLAQAGVTAGLSADMLKFVSTSLSASINAKAGAKAQQETSNLFRAAVGAQSQQAPQGLFGGYGGVLGSSLFGEQMGGGKGFQEIVAGDINTRRGPQVNLGNDLQTGMDYVSDPAFRQYVNRKGNLPQGAQSALGMSGVPFASDIAKFAAPFAGPFGPMLQDLVSPQAAQPWVSPKTTMGAAPASDIETYMNDLNASGKRAQDSLGKTTKVTYEWASSLDEVTKASDIAVAAGDKFGLDLAQNSGIIVKVNGQIAKSVKDYQDAVSQVNLGKTIVEAGVWAQMNVRQLNAQKQARVAQQQLTMALEIPYATTKNLLQQPLVAPGLGFFPGATTGQPSAAAAGMTSPAAGMAQQALASSAGSNVRLGAIAGQGMVQALNQVGQFNPASLPNFAMLAIQSQMSAARIADLTTKMGKLNQESSQFNWDNQIRIATRTLGDALGMLGKSGGTALGKMERSMHLLDIQSTSLGLQLQQRGITTALAQAQFQAPGQTGEERFFAQKEAIAKAGIQQEQLNISTKEFNLSKQIWVENANRSATDAQKAITSMQLARNAEGYTIAAQEAIAKEGQIMATTVAGMDAILGTATGNWGDVLSAATQGVGQFAGTLKDGTDALRKILGYSPITTGNAGRNDGGKATGYLGSASRPTDVTFGEAGTETVAILRNPRAGTLAATGGGGTSGSVTVNINGPVVRNEQDIAELARCVAAEVEKSLARKGQMFGLRGAAV